MPYIAEFSKVFAIGLETETKDNYYILTPNTKNPYQQMYTAN